MGKCVQAVHAKASNLAHAKEMIPIHVESHIHLVSSGVWKLSTFSLYSHGMTGDKWQKILFFRLSKPWKMSLLEGVWWATEISIVQRHPKEWFGGELLALWNYISEKLSCIAKTILVDSSSEKMTFFQKKFEGAIECMATHVSDICEEFVPGGYMTEFSASASFHLCDFIP